MRIRASDELDGLALGTVQEERERAKNWMDTAAQHCKNEFYWKARAEKAEEKEWNRDFRALISATISRPLTPAGLKSADEIIEEARVTACKMQDVRARRADDAKKNER
jgi:broad specificity polyphosphatase/5'/3'-nucleotidase SurE